MRMIKVEASTSGVSRDTAAGAFKNFYLVSPEDRALLPKVFPFALVLNYSPEPISNSPFPDSLITLALKRMGVLNALKPLPHVASLFSNQRHPVISATKPNELGNFFDGGFVKAPNVLVVVPGRVYSISSKRNVYSFFRPWAFSYTADKAYARGKKTVKTLTLRAEVKSFLRHTEPHLIWAGRDRGHLCASCDRAMLAVMNTCEFPRDDCPLWRNNGRALLSLPA